MDYESEQTEADRSSKLKKANKFLIFTSEFSTETDRIPNFPLNFVPTELAKLKNWQGLRPTELRTFSETDWLAAFPKTLLC
jgi:hypothetical protein